MASGGILSELNNPNRSRDTKPVRVPTAEEYRRQLEEDRAHQREIERLVDLAIETEHAQHLQGERKQREAEISKLLDEYFADHLADVIEEELPPEETRRKYIAQFKVFEQFCREQGVGSLPAAPETIFYFCVFDLKPQEVEGRLAALKWVHRVNKKYWPEAYARAAEKWAQETKPLSSGEDNAAKPKPNGNGAVH